MLKPGDTIEYLEDVSSPPNQKGVKRQTKVIDQDIPLRTAKFLLSAGKIRPYDQSAPLKIKNEEMDTGPPRLKPGDTIEYLDDVSSPPNQKGTRGQTKVIGRDIPLWSAKFLLRGGKIRPSGDSSVKPSTGSSSEPSAGSSVKPSKNAASTVRERRIRTNVGKRADGKRDQEGDTAIKD